LHRFYYYQLKWGISIPQGEKQKRLKVQCPAVAVGGVGCTAGCAFAAGFS
jgi:hypothetical protein